MTTEGSAPRTEAGDELRELYPAVPTTAQGLRLAEEWWSGGGHLLNELHGSVPERIKAIEEQARAEGRREAVRDLLVNARANDWTDDELWPLFKGMESEAAGLNASPTSETSIDAHWRETVERYASESGQPTRDELDALERETYEADPSSPYYRGQPPEAGDE